jgi:hypothetical protein
MAESWVSSERLMDGEKMTMEGGEGDKGGSLTFAFLYHIFIPSGLCIEKM